MQSSLLKLLLASAVCVATYSTVQADNKVTVTGFNVDIPSNDIVDSWNHDLANNLIASTINVKKNCPGMIEADIRIYQGGNMVNQMNQKFDKPIKDFENYGICASVDSPDPDDDMCSVAEGEQTAKDCDVGSLFSSMSPGEYRAECDFKQSDNIIATVQIDVKVESG